LASSRSRFCAPYTSIVSAVARPNSMLLRTFAARWLLSATPRGLNGNSIVMPTAPW
jgi:hypothetical protein